MIVVATGRNPNVFYEAGYAVALGKEVVTITDEYGQLPFDIRDRNAIAYGNDSDSVRDRLESKLAKLTWVD